MASYQHHYESVLEDFYAHNSESFASREEAEHSEDFHILLEIFGRYEEEAPGDRDMSPDSELAQALVALGRREPDWDWNVGETP